MVALCANAVGVVRVKPGGDGDGDGENLAALASARSWSYACRELLKRISIDGEISVFGSTVGSGDFDVAPDGSVVGALSGLNRPPEADGTLAVRMLPSGALTPLFEAVAEATEEAIVNALCAATTTTGIEGRVAYAIPLDRLREIMRRYGRLDESAPPARP